MTSAALASAVVDMDWRGSRILATLLTCAVAPVTSWAHKTAKTPSAGIILDRFDAVVKPSMLL